MSDGSDYVVRNENEKARALQELDRLREERKQLNVEIVKLVKEIKQWESGLRRVRLLEQYLAGDGRNRAICEMRAGGAEYKQIAVRFNISKGRARQIFEYQQWRERRRAAEVLSTT